MSELENIGRLYAKYFIAYMKYSPSITLLSIIVAILFKSPEGDEMLIVDLCLWITLITISLSGTWQLIFIANKDTDGL